MIRGDAPPDDGRLTHWEGEPVRVWESLWEVPCFEAWRTLGSTNDRLRRLAGRGEPPFTVVVAEEQTAGRGRAGRTWFSPPGLGLWMSILTRPAALDARLLAPLLAGLAAARALERQVPGLEVGIKWPNDLGLGERKVGGVLCETQGDAVLVGIGVNIGQAPPDFPPDLRDRAVSIAMATGSIVARGPLAGRIVEEVRRVLARPVLRLEGNLAEELRRRDILADRPVRVRATVGQGELAGIARGITPTGELRLELEDGHIERIAAGSVRSGSWEEAL